MFQSDAWIIASSFSKHDFDFHKAGLTRVLDHYSSEGGAKEAQIGLTQEGVVDGEGDSPSQLPLISIFTDGCAKKYKGTINFRLVTYCEQQLGVIIQHIFAATSHCQGPHDGIGGVVKKQLRKTELFVTRIPDCAAVVAYLQQYFDKRSDDLEG